ncbi:LysR family transcriptional regulator [Arthrobacter sp. zg-Y820]|uniref:LysR family transcriptional regulator n=1 Tax=unclassified Arthrobacter TaxID=235627 RepID=UPI001E5490D7|nr:MULTISPECIES: LysR family transcriptional regulator [unclassified Arthrobacter]MCC9195402.1 LysR family transcriptional regulator [Arthrobacter sp. zg-Y820]MDK1278261.1 LysR family transcriptional regulator [Arthrobacter sp. zg.Y820]WIB10142.1 LysR family transcriptional regulator [Arthrobacter sp. zg-Y820]
MFTLDQARSFIAVAEELHFGRAAVRLNMTQPPLSRQIQKLEREVSVELLERDKRNVVLTAGGRAFLIEARKLVAAADRAPRTARRMAQGSAGIIRIGFTAAAGYSRLGPILREIAEALPGVDVELEELVTSEQIQALSHGDLDLGLARPPFDTERFESHLLFSEDLRLAVPSGHPLDALNRPITAADLRDTPLIMHSSTKARYFYDLAVRLIPIEHHNVIHTVSQILTMVALVAAGRGVAIVPESARILQFEGVSYLPLAGEASDAVQLHAIWNRDSANPALGRVLELLRTPST